MASNGTFREAWVAVRRSKRLIALVTVVVALVCAPAALFVGLSMDLSSALSVQASEMAERLDLDLLADMRVSGEHDATVTALVVATFVLLFFVWPMVMGGWVGVAAKAPERIRFDEFVKEGGAVYWKYLRLSLIGLVVVYLLSIAARPLLEYIDEQAGDIASEGTPMRYRRITEMVVFAFYWVLGTILDYTRVGVRMHRRPGVFAELVRSTVFIMQHPIETLGFSAFTLLLEVAVLWGFAMALPAIDGAYIVTSVAMLLLTQVLIGLRQATRLLHVAGAWRIRWREEGVDPAEAERSADKDDLLSDLPWNE